MKKIKIKIKTKTFQWHGNNNLIFNKKKLFFIIL